MASGSGQSSASLTEEQRRRMEENRKKALEKLQSRQITSSPRLVQGTAGQSTLRIHHESCSTVYSQHSGAQSYGKSPFQRNLFTTDHATNSQSCESKKKLMTTGACLTDGVPKPKEDLKSPWYARFSYKTESPSNKNTQAISFGTNKFGRNAGLFTPLFNVCSCYEIYHCVN